MRFVFNRILKSGKLGHGDTESCLIPKRIEGLNVKFEKVCCGDNHNLAIAEGLCLTLICNLLIS